MKPYVTVAEIPPLISDYLKTVINVKTLECVPISDINQFIAMLEAKVPKEEPYEDGWAA